MRFNLEILSLGGGICQGRDFSIFIQQKWMKNDQISRVEKNQAQI